MQLHHLIYYHCSHIGEKSEFHMIPLLCMRACVCVCAHRQRSVVDGGLRWRVRIKLVTV